MVSLKQARRFFKLKTRLKKKTKKLYCHLGSVEVTWQILISCSSKFLFSPVILTACRKVSYVENLNVSHEQQCNHLLLRFCTILFMLLVFACYILGWTKSGDMDRCFPVFCDDFWLYSYHCTRKHQLGRVWKRLEGGWKWRPDWFCSVSHDYSASPITAQTLWKVKHRKS